MKRVVAFVSVILPLVAVLAGWAQAGTSPAQSKGVVAVGHIIHMVPPFYPPIAKASRVQGTVVIHAVIGKDGSVNSPTIVSGPTILQQSALDAVRQWKYQPYMLDGAPVEVVTTLNVAFSLGDGQPLNAASSSQPAQTTETAATGQQNHQELTAIENMPASPVTNAAEPSAPSSALQSNSPNACPTGSQSNFAEESSKHSVWFYPLCEATNVNAGGECPHGLSRIGGLGCSTGIASCPNGYTLLKLSPQSPHPDNLEYKCHITEISIPSEKLALERTVLKEERSQCSGNDDNAFCRADFLNSLKLKTVRLNLQGVEGVVVIISDLCGSDMCPAKVLMKSGGNYREVLSGDFLNIKVKATTTNGFYDLVDYGKYSTTSYVWSGSRYVAATGHRDMNNDGSSQTDLVKAALHCEGLLPKQFADGRKVELDIIPGSDGQLGVILFGRRSPESIDRVWQGRFTQTTIGGKAIGWQSYDTGLKSTLFLNPDDGGKMAWSLQLATKRSDGSEADRYLSGTCSSALNLKAR